MLPEIKSKATNILLKKYGIDLITEPSVRSLKFFRTNQEGQKYHVTNRYIINNFIKQEIPVKEFNQLVREKYAELYKNWDFKKEKKTKQPEKNNNGKKGGYVKGKSHDKGGVKAVVTDAGNRPIEVEGGEVIITKKAVTDKEKHEFDGRILTNKQILSEINENAGGVAIFKKGGKIISEKLLKNPNIEDTELVSTEEIYKYIDFVRDGKDSLSFSKENIKNLEKSISENGFTDPLILTYFQNEKKALLEEGNHRIVAAKILKLDYIPVRVIRTTRTAPYKAKDIKGIEPDKYGYVPANLKPSQIGIKKTKNISAQKFLFGGNLGLTENLIKFLPKSQVNFILESNTEELKPVLNKLDAVIEKMPVTYKSDDTDPIVYLHYFINNSDFYVTEKDIEDEQIQAFGYTILNGDIINSELGYINIEELKDIPQMQLDFYFNPVPLSELKRKIFKEEDEEENKSKKNDKIEEIYTLEKNSYRPEEIRIIQNKETGLYFLQTYSEKAERWITHESYKDKSIAINSADSMYKKVKDLSSGKKQEQITAEIREIIDRNGINYLKYSPEELYFIRKYEGLGGLANSQYISKLGIKDKTSILDQFFTPYAVIQKMWGLALKYGYNPEKNNRILEPAVGTGRFLEYIPNPEKQIVDAFDVDYYASVIAKLSFPKFNIQNKSFETLFFKGNTHIGVATVKPYDLVIGNPPYKSYASKYSAIKGVGKKTEKTITKAETFDQYMLMRGIDLLKPKGLLIFIIPSSFLMNAKKYNAFKDLLNLKAELTDAYRLPNGIFPNTEILTDIVVFKKR